MRMTTHTSKGRPRMSTEPKTNRMFCMTQTVNDMLVSLAVARGSSKSETLARLIEKEYRLQHEK